MPLPQFNDDLVNAKAVAKLARSKKVPLVFCQEQMLCGAESVLMNVIVTLTKDLWISQLGPSGILVWPCQERFLIRLYVYTTELKPSPIRLKAGSNSKLGSLPRGGVRYLAT